MFRYVKGAQREAGGKSKEPIAIVGVAFRLPGANNRHTLWGNLMSAKDSVGLVPSNRWTKEKGCRRLKKESVPIKAGFIDWDVGKFDANFWGLSPLELGFIDPQARLMLQLSWEVGTGKLIICISWVTFLLESLRFDVSTFLGFCKFGLKYSNICAFLGPRGRRNSPILPTWNFVFCACRQLEG